MYSFYYFHTCMYSKTATTPTEQKGAMNQYLNTYIYLHIHTYIHLNRIYCETKIDALPWQTYLRIVCSYVWMHACMYVLCVRMYAFLNDLYNVAPSLRVAVRREWRPPSTSRRSHWRSPRGIHPALCCSPGAAPISSSSWFDYNTYIHTYIHDVHHWGKWRSFGSGHQQCNVYFGIVLLV